MKTIYRRGPLSIIRFSRMPFIKWNPLAWFSISFPGKEARYRWMLEVTIWRLDLSIRWWSKNADRWERR